MSISKKLEEMQTLPHKWWKKNKTYVPCTENILVDFYDREFRIEFVSYEFRKDILALSKYLEITTEVIPTRFDYMYAINTELLEYDKETHFEAKRLERADVAIFCALFLRLHYNWSAEEFLDWPAKNIRIDVSPVYSWLPNVQRHVKNLLIWGITGGKVLEKIDYNKGRADHDYSRC